MLARHAGQGKIISQSEFTALIDKLYRENDKSADDRVSLYDGLVTAGYEPELRDIRFDKLTKKLQRFIFDDLVCDQLTFINCMLIAGLYPDCLFRDCDFKNYHSVDHTLFKMPTMQADEQFKFSRCIMIADNYTPRSTICLRITIDHGCFINLHHRRPLLVVVYTPQHGTANTDLLINVLISSGIQILKLYPYDLRYDPIHQTPLHPIFSTIKLIDGIVLPGGMDVVTDQSHYTAREKLEAYLMQQSLTYRIPTLGVCRGHQFVGHYLGAEIKDVEGHAKVDKADKDIISWQTNIIHVQPGTSMLSKLVSRQYDAQVRKRKFEEIEKEENGYNYQSLCAHHQGLFFGERAPKRLRVTARADDGLPESLQVRDHIVTFQHHHEVMQDTSMGSSALKQFASMVTDYHDKKHRTRSSVSFKM